MIGNVKCLSRMVVFCFALMLTAAAAVFAKDNDLITVKGTGAPNANMPAGQAKLMACRAAMADAYRNLSEQIMGVMVDSQTTVKNFVTESDVINTKVQGFIKGAEKLNERVLADGTCEVTVQASKNQLLELFPPLQPVYAPVETEVKKKDENQPAKDPTNFWSTHTKSIDVSPEASSHNKKGLEYLSQAKYEDASAEFQASADADPKFDLAWCNLGIAQMDLKQYDTAESNMKKAVSIDDGWSDHHVNLAYLYVRMNRLDDAKAEAQRGIDIYEKNEWAQDAMALVYESLEDFQNAAVYEKKAAQYCPDDDPYKPTYYYYLGMDYKKLGKNADAKAQFKAALKYRADYWEAQEAMKDL